MRHLFYNVGHAEAILIQPDPQTIIVRDFGKNKKANQDYYYNYYMAYNDIINAYNAGFIIDAAVSHAHADHINGFIELYNNNPTLKIFRTAYLPNQNFANSKTLHYVLLRFSVYCLLIYGRNTRIRQAANNWLKFRPIITALSQNVRDVSLGDQITAWTTNATVLWPPNFNNNCPSYAKDDYITLLNAVETLDSDQPSEFLEELRDANHRLVRLLTTSSDESDQEDGQDKVQAMRQVLNSLIRSFGHRITNRRRHAIFTPQIMMAYKHCIDNDSLVFGFNDHSALYLSDLYPDAMSAMIAANPHIPLHYSLLKSAHHGTRICPELKNNGQFDAIIHCCGISNKNYGGPIIDYNACGNHVVCLDWDYVNTKYWDPKVPQDPKTIILNPNIDRVLIL